jgi:hypothetical protein
MSYSTEYHNMKRCVSSYKFFTERRSVVVNINCMEHSRSWKANSGSPDQQIPVPLWKPKLYYHIKQRLPTVHILSQMNPVRTITAFF